MLHLRKILMFVLVAIGAPIQAQEQQTVVALFGDSITVGENSQNRNLQRGFGAGRTDLGLPDKLLSELLNDSDRPSVVVNWGAGGSPTGPSLNPGLVATTNGLERISSNLAQTKGQHPADNYYVLILYGTNDAAWSIDPSTTGFNIRGMIDRARSRGYIPVIGTILPRSGLNSAYNANILASANFRAAATVDHFANFTGQPALLDDGIHPTNEGYAIVAQEWFDSFLAAEIESLTKLSLPPVILLLLDD